MGHFGGLCGDSFMATLGKPFYTGLFRHGLDDKNRLTIPSAWRAAHASDDAFLAVPNPAGFITVLPPAEVEKLYAKVAEVPMGDLEAQRDIAGFFAVAQAFSFDKQGRVALSDELRARAGITKDAVMSGILSKFNIYSPAKWDELAAATSPASQAGFMSRFGI